MMKCSILICLLLASPALAVETMRIAMGEVESEVEIRGEGLSLGADSEEAPFTLDRDPRVLVRRHGTQLEVNGAVWADGVVRVRSGTVDASGRVGAGSSLHAGAWDVRGDVVLRVHGSKLQLINVIPLEDYLAAVLGGEMPVSFPSEALKAQAVAARTYAVQKKLEALGQPYFLGSSVLAQVYGGIHREDARTRAAVDATRGQILTFQLAPIEAYFHSSCGGRTESGLAALNRDLPYLKSVECPCGHLAASRWSLQLAARDLEGAFHEKSSVSVLSRTDTGRARRVQVGGRSMDAVAFRQRIGYDRVKSLAFSVEREKSGNFLLSGRGYGHGAGLCQWGAKAYADAGWSYGQILSHYYPGAELQQLY